MAATRRRELGRLIKSRGAKRLAKSLGVSESTVRRWRREGMPASRADTARKVAGLAKRQVRVERIAPESRALEQRRAADLHALERAPVTYPDRLAFLKRHYTWRELAYLLKVPDKALRAGSHDLIQTREWQKMFAALVHTTRTDIAREIGAQPKKRKAPRGKTVKRYDRQTKKFTPSDSRDYHVMNLHDETILSILRRARERAILLGHDGGARFLVLGETGSPDYPDEFFYTEWETLADRDDDGLREIIEQAAGRGMPIVLRVLWR